MQQGEQQKLFRQTALDQASAASASAIEANANAVAALTSLSTVEDVVGTLNWISEHGTFAKTRDVQGQTGKHYFSRSGSGTTAVTAKKLGRAFTAIEQDRDYCCLALERLHRADADNTIQGYEDGVFWERNTQSVGGQVLH